MCNRSIGCLTSVIWGGIRAGQRLAEAAQTELPKMSLNFSRKPLRPVAEEMLSIRVRDVRPLVAVAHETLSMAAWSEAIHRLALQVGVDEPAPDHQLEISRAWELLKENGWATKQSSWHRGGWPSRRNNPFNWLVSPTVG